MEVVPVPGNADTTMREPYVATLGAELTSPLG